MTENRKLRLGAAVVQRLLPHRPPMLFVDFIAGYEPGPRPSLRAGRHIAANDATFAGHFPGLAVWPGVYTIEGLNQACNLLAVIAALQARWRDAGRDPDEVLEALRQLDQHAQLKASARADALAPLLALLADAGATIGLSAAVDVRFTAPVFPGCRLDYHVVHARADAAADRFEVEALVDGAPVARGGLLLSKGRALPARRLEPNPASGA